MSDQQTIYYNTSAEALFILGCLAYAGYEFEHDEEAKTFTSSDMERYVPEEIDMAKYAWRGDIDALAETIAEEKSQPLVLVYPTRDHLIYTVATLEALRIPYVINKADKTIHVNSMHTRELLHLQNTGRRFISNLGV